MTSTRWKLAAALGVAGAIALSIPSADARGGRKAALGFGIAAGALALGAAAAAASQPRYHYHSGYYGGPYAYGYSDPYAYSPSPYVYDSYGYHGHYGSYGYHGSPAYRSGSYQ